jgi:hypothetical protein
MNRLEMSKTCATGLSSTNLCPSRKYRGTSVWPEMKKRQVEVKGGGLARFK